MEVVQAFFNLFSNIDFVSVGLTLASGAVWGAMFQNWELDKRTVFVLISLYLPLFIGQVLYNVSMETVMQHSDTNHTYLSIIYYALYFIGALLTRKLLHGRIVDSTPETFKKIRQ